MGRPENVLDPSAGPVEEFAYRLRELREAAGRPGYRELSVRAGFSVTVLAAAARGDRLPSLPVAVAFAQACGGERVEWERRWRDAAAQAAASAATADGEDGAPPYLGLAVYEVADAERFFGRDRLIGDLLALLREGRFVAVFGPSGSGKSSLLRAGVAARAAVRDDGGDPVGGPARRRVLAVVVTPGAHPMHELTRALADALAGQGIAVPPAGAITNPGAAGAVDVTGMLQAMAGTRSGLLGEFGEGVDGGAEVEVLVVVDQFEEVFTLCRDRAERAVFIEVLLSARRAGSRVRVVLGIRPDFFGACAEHRDLAQALRKVSVLVPPMTAGELREVIVKPAAAQHVTVEPALVATIIRDAGTEPGALPLVSHALLETWQRRRGKAITLHAYQAAGGIDGAIAQTAERAYTALTSPQQRLTRQILLRLTTLGEDGQATRQPLPRSDLDDLGTPDTTPDNEADLDAPGTNTGIDDEDPEVGDIAVVLHRLTGARLITLNQDSIQLAHEALIGSWPRLREWLAEDREQIRARQRLTDAAATWQELDRDPAALYRGARLAAAQEWSNNLQGPADGPAGLTVLERSFLHASTQAQGAEQAQIIRRNRRLRALAAMLVVLLVAAVTAAGVAVRQSRIADQRALQAQSRQLAAQARGLASADPGEAARLAVRAYRAAPTLEARGSLLSVAAGPLSTTRFEGPPGPQSIAVSPDGRFLAKAADPLPPRRLPMTVWDTRRGTQVAVLVPPSSASSAAFSADGRLIAVACVDGSIVVWDWATGQKLTTVAGGHRLAVRIAFSADGRRIASTDAQTVMIWDGDGSRIASDDDQSVIIWDLDGGKKTATYRGGRWLKYLNTYQGQWLRSRSAPTPATTNTVNTAAREDASFPFDLFPGYSNDGHVQATQDDGNTIVVRDTRTGRDLLTVNEVDDGRPIWALSPDGRVLYYSAIGDSQDDIVAWDIPARSRALTLPLARSGAAARARGTSEAISQLIVSKDGRLLISAEQDGLIHLWDRARMPLIGTTTTNGANTLAYSPDGRTLATAGTAATTVWDLPSRAPAAILPTDNKPALTLAYNRGGTLLATSTGTKVQVWDTATYRRLRDLDHHQDTAHRIGFGSDGRLLTLTTSTTTTARPPLLGQGDMLDLNLWDLRTGTGVRAYITTTLDTHPSGETLTCLHSDALQLHQTTLACPTGKIVSVFDLERHHQLGYNQDHTNSITAVALSPANHLLAAASRDNRILIWDTRHPAKTIALTNHTTPPTTLAFSPDGATLAAASGNTITLWNLTTRTLWATLTGHTGTITTLTYHPDHTTLASTATDHTTRLWNLNPQTALNHLTTSTPP